MEINSVKNLEQWPIDELKKYERNARTHSESQVQKIAASILQFGFNSPILIDSQSGIIAGHGRLEAAKSLGMDFVPVVIVDHLSEQQKRAYIIADNKLQELGGWDRDILGQELEALKMDGFDISSTGFSDEELERAMAFLPDLPPIDGEASQSSNAGSESSSLDGKPNNAAESGGENSELANGINKPEDRKKLSDSFIVPPFSVLDCRKGYWQERKRQWLGMGIRSEVGRGENLLQMRETMLEPDAEKRAIKAALEQADGDQDQSVDYVQKLNNALTKGGGGGFSCVNVKIPGYYDKIRAGKTPEQIIKEWLASDSQIKSGTSIFDPVLCELSYRWFSPVDGIVLDPFAGGSVRGIVASKLGRKYFGCDLRSEQVDANKDQADAICSEKDPLPVWVAGDSREIDKHHPDVEADFLFSCPPYADLEVYSDDERDLSTLEYEEFRKAYAEIIAKSVAMLKNDRFACFVVGEVREKNKAGFYNNFVLDTIMAFEAAGARFYNEMILLTSVGTLALRAGRTFSSSRKIGKTHQNILVFCKGDPWKAVEACGEVDVTLPEGMEIDPETQDVVVAETKEQAYSLDLAVEKTNYGDKITSIGGEL